jgi:hypothetical protein
VPDFRALILKHRGARICVMGGAPSLDLDLAKVKADVFISVNAHGAHHPHDYIVAMDEEHGTLRVPMRAYLQSMSAAPVIGPRAWNDYALTTWPDYPKTGVLSGMVACWVAWAMGARVVVLAGMNAYDGSPSGMAHCSAVVRDVKCPIRVMGGPLAKVWPIYCPAEEFGEYEMHPSIEALQGIDGMTRIRALKPCSQPGLALAKGGEVDVMRHQVARLLKNRLVEEILIPKSGTSPEIEAQAAAQPAKRRGRPPKAKE